VNIYLDIDGVLITKNGQPSHGVKNFLEYITSNHDVYWLSTHCRGGESNVVGYLRDKLTIECLEYIKKIKATDWKTLKTEAIDFTKDFRWFDDHVMEAEKKVLLNNNKLNCLVLVTSDYLFSNFNTEVIL